MDIPTDSPKSLYLGLLIAPFIQEDAAVIAAASFAVQKLADPKILFVTICIGLFFSDIWKYWIGWAALRNKPINEWANRPRIMDMQERVRLNPIKTLFTARFIPMTRIPCYVACGFCGVPYLKYCIVIAITAILYAGIIFALFFSLGAILGEKLLWVLPAAAIFTLIAYLVYKKMCAIRAN